MTNTLAAVLLCAQLLLFQPCVSDKGLSAAESRCVLPAPQRQTGSVRLWWGMIDPELSVWFAHIPQEAEETEERILWDWSWRGFFASLFGQTAEMEESPDAAIV